MSLESPRPLGPKVAITTVNLYLLQDSLKSAPPDGAGLPLQSHLAWQEVEEGKKKKKERKEKENGKNKGKYIREKAMAFVPQNGMVPGGKLEAEEKISAWKCSWKKSSPIG